MIAFTAAIGPFDFNLDSRLPGIVAAPERYRVAKIVRAGTDAHVPIIERTHDRYTEVELHRSHGDLLKTTVDLLGVVQIDRRAIAVAQSQNAMRLNCPPPPALPTSGAIRVSIPKPVICLRRSTPGSPKAGQCAVGRSCLRD